MQSEKIIDSRVLALGAVCESSAVYNSSDASMAELKSLVKTAGGKVEAIMIQNRKSPDPATYLGEGKVEEARQLALANDCDLAVFDGELSPSQLKNLEAALEVRVIDRSMLILDIFALHAVTGEGKLQVELAQLKYTMPRLTGKGIELSRLGGGIGTRGPGETKLETDRRHIRSRIASVKAELEELKKNRLQQRRSRDESGIPRIGIIGYTNAGKSTLLNLLTGSDVISADKLFATLDPTTRKMTLPDGMDVVLTDTVGFIRNLPHHLIEAFASTLDEVRFSDLLLHVVDISNPDFEDQIRVVETLVDELGAKEIPVIMVFNKADKVPAEEFPYFREGVLISAKNSRNIDGLLKLISEKLYEKMTRLEVVIPYSKGNLLSLIHDGAVVIEEKHLENGTYLSLSVDKRLAAILDEFKVENGEL